MLRSIATRADEIGSTTAPAIWKLADGEAAEELEQGGTPNGGMANGSEANGAHFRKRNYNTDVDAGVQGEGTPGKGLSGFHGAASAPVEVA